MLAKSCYGRNNIMPHTLVYINGRKIDYRRASVSVFDYTLHCGIGLFESVLAIDGRLIFADEHLDRMEQGIASLGLDRLNFNRDRIAKTLKRAASDHPGHIRKIKLFLTQGYSPLWPGSKPGPRSIIIITDHRLVFQRQKLLVSPMTIDTADPMRGRKTLNFMTEWISQDRAIKAGFDQGIIINQRGRIAETGSANIFLVKNGVLITPPLSSGGLPGTIRKEIIRLARANHIPCREKPITPEELIDADEIFTTSSFKLVWPVVCVRLDTDYSFEPGRLSRAFFDRLKTNFLTGDYETTLKM